MAQQACLARLKLSYRNCKGDFGTGKPGLDGTGCSLSRQRTTEPTDNPIATVFRRQPSDRAPVGSQRAHKLTKMCYTDGR